MSTIIARNCFGVVVAQEEDNGYINITKLAKAYQQQTGKRRDPSEWLSNKRTRESINHLNSVTGIPVSQLVITRKGNSSSIEQGTFVHPKLALRFGIWLSDEFGYMVEEWFEEWATGKTKLQQPAEKPKLSLEEIAFFANFASETAQNAGVSKAVAESLKLDSVRRFAPAAEPLLMLHKKAIASANPLPEKALSPTELGVILSKKLGIAKVSARAVNKKLIQLEYQVSIKRVRKSTGKTVHDYYQATEKGKAYSQLEMSAYPVKEANSTKYQLRWFSGIIEILVSEWAK